MNELNRIIKELSRREIGIINVGGNTDYKESPPGPLFGDGTFKFIPIKEYYPGNATPTYKELLLGEWVKNSDEYAHNDPEFVTMTFGDWENRSRTSNISDLKKGDFLVFLSALANKEDMRKRKSSGLYFIGFFEIERIIPFNEARKSMQTRNNAHVLREEDEGYSVWKGTELSALFHNAIPLNKNNSNRILRTKNGELLPWGKLDKKGRRMTDLQIINSHTRTSRKITDKCRGAFWRIIFETNHEILKNFL